MHTYSHHLSSMTSPPKKKVHKRGRSTCRRTPRFVAVCIVHSVHVGCWGKALHRWSWIEPRGCDPNATLSGVTIPDLLNFRRAGGRFSEKNTDPLWNVGNLHSFETINHAYYCQDWVFLNQRFQTRNLRKNGETTLDLLELHSASSHRDFHSRSLASDQSIVVHDVLAPKRILWTWAVLFLMWGGKISWLVMQPEIKVLKVKPCGANKMSNEALRFRKTKPNKCFKYKLSIASYDYLVLSCAIHVWFHHLLVVTFRSYCCWR